jgi:hypothetical protein
VPQITDQERFVRENILAFVSKGPLDGMWRCAYLKCPRCGYYVLRGGGYDECPCGNIAIDSDMLRVQVQDTPESEVVCSTRSGAGVGELCRSAASLGLIARSSLC